MQIKKVLQKVLGCCAVLALLFGADLASAQLIFQREELTISPPPAISIKDKEDAASPKPEPRASHDFKVEVRSEEALNLEYIHTLNGLKKDDGVMIAFNAPSIVSVPVMNVYQPVDILFINDDGIIVQIVPSITPAEINRTIEATEPIRAFLYIASGEAKRLDIRPRDVVSHGVFNAKPIVLQ